MDCPMAESQTAEQSRMFWPSIDKHRSQQLLQWDQLDFARLVWLFTGHNNLNSHRAKTGEAEDNTCHLCLEGVESSKHILCQCIDLTMMRSCCVGKPVLTKPSELSQVPLGSVRQFISLICQWLQEEGVDKI